MSHILEFRIYCRIYDLLVCLHHYTILYFTLLYFTLLYFTSDLLDIVLCLVIGIINQNYLPAR